MDGIAMSHDVVGEAELPLESVGARLARAREAAGLSRSAMAAQTKIPERHLAAIEAGDFAALPARTYAVGFSRSYAKALGLDDRAVVDEVRMELAALEPENERRHVPAFEPGDPARIPGSRFAWLAALGAVAVIVAGFAFWRGYYAPGGALPSILPAETPAAAAPPPVAAAPAPAPAPTGGPVVFTAERDRVWVKFVDGAGNQLLQKELTLGESYTLPANVADVKLDTAHPEALAITVGGRPVPKLADRQAVLKNVPVTAAVLLARPAPSAPAPVAVAASQDLAPRTQRSAVPAAGAAAAPAAAVPAAAAAPAGPAPSPAAT